MTSNNDLFPSLLFAYVYPALVYVQNMLGRSLRSHLIMKSKHLLILVPKEEFIIQKHLYK
jgi:hypothetical protein